ncbi:MAG TPA: TM0106 family RecB-like putative nuclease [Candidatus Eisenbacteria bacterium]|nr:TM0106 family RecB-like putative nuclease [Candidatus Eisenbacteria bacterium]
MLNGSHFLSYAACPRIVFLDLHGDRHRRAPATEFHVMLGEESKRHEAEVIESLSAHVVSFERADLASGLRRTREALQDGLPLVAGGVLGQTDASGRLIGLAFVDLLERVPGASRFGDFHYEVVEIKRASRGKPSYRMQVAYHSDVLAELQGVAPRRGHLILSDGRRESFDLAPLFPRYRKVLAKLREIDDGAEPPLFVSSQCASCSWQAVCLPEAEQRSHLSMVFGLSRQHVETLESHGVHDYHQLARVAPKRLGGWVRASESKAREHVAQAKALSSEDVVWRKDAGLPASDTEIFFDVEGDPERGVLYLFGVLVRERRLGREIYKPFVAERPEQEAQAFLECLAFLERYAKAPIYHYHHYERTVLDRLVERHGADPLRVERLGERLCDLSERVSRCCFLPVRSYSLKSVARYLGFEWTSAKSSAVQSVVWFTSWQRTGERVYLERAIEYNADDCRATRVLKDWLASGPHGQIEIEEDGALMAPARGLV